MHKTRLDRHAAEAAKRRDTIRRAYLRTQAIELGMPNADICDLALREVAALIELVQELGAPPVGQR